MSGPKTSIYTLTVEQRRILEEQRKIERRKAVASENIKRKNKRLLQIGAMFSSEKKVAAELNERCGNDGGFLEKISELEDLIAPIATIVLRTNNDDVTALENTAMKSEAEKLKTKKQRRATTKQKTIKKE